MSIPLAGELLIVLRFCREREESLVRTIVVIFLDVDRELFNMKKEEARA